MEHPSDRGRWEILEEIADMYYNQGKTQSEIAQYFDTNRFRVAKLLQDARAEHVVEIRINHSNERNRALEKELEKGLGLSRALVVNTRYSPYIDSLNQIGKAGAGYLAGLLEPGAVVGVTWGKTIYSVVRQLSPVAHNPVTAVQLAGYLSLTNPVADSAELVRMIAAAYSGTCHYLTVPVYIRDRKAREAMLREPAISRTLDKTGNMNVVLSGIGGRSSLPVSNPAVRPYLTDRDCQAAESCLGSLYGYVLDGEGNAADIDLNRKLVGAALEDILKVPHRFVVACGRHKAQVIGKAAGNGLFNELLTDADTAAHILEMI